MSKYKTIIHIEGRSIEDVFRLPCVSGCEKTSVSGVVRFTFYPLSMAHPSQFQTAMTDDTLCEDESGKWHILRTVNGKQVEI